MAIKYLMCVAGGMALGYAYAYSRAEREFQEQLERESEEARYHYRDKYEKKLKEFMESEGIPPSSKNTEALAAQAAETMRQTYEGGESAVSTIVSDELSRVARKGVAQGDVSVPEEDENFVHDRVSESVRKKGLTVDGAIIDGVKKTPVVNYNRISTPEKTEEPKIEKSQSEGAADEDEMDIEIEFITRNAFVADEFGYKQYSFTYFAGDDVLTNESDEPVTSPTREESIGAEALRKLKIGREAMGGQNEIYVRNRTGNWEFAIVRSDGKFSDEVEAEAG